MGGGQRVSSSDSEDIHTFARDGNLEALQSICISNPLAVNARDKLSRTPLHLAAWAGQLEVVAFLCKHKADVGAAANDDMGAIHFASQKGHLAVVRTLLLSGVSVNASTRKGFTALHYASQRGHLELVKYLVRKGAKIGAKIKAGKSAIDVTPSEEVRTFLMSCEEPSKDGKDVGKARSVLSDEKSGDNSSIKESKKEGGHTSPSYMDVSKNGAGSSIEEVIEDAEGSEKKRGREEGKGSESVPKKARVALGHLLANDDVSEEM
ncbi:hypothetical protein AMTRI_Chr03g144790 [Amborella trichopoda]